MSRRSWPAGCDRAGTGEVAGGAWARGGGWSVAVYKNPSAAALDAITGERPAYFDDVDGHSAWVNTAALKAAKIDANTKDPEGGRIERDAQGNPTGLLRETARTGRRSDAGLS